MISYAQNQEDVVLHRLLKFVQNGTYVDVGAAHPIIHNVTYSLYLEGWRGINVEPMSAEAEMLRSSRPKDITYQLAVGASVGKVLVHTGPSDNRGASTTRSDIAERYRSSGQDFSTETVEMVRLESLIAEAGLNEIHILKIDVEGLEADVIEGASLATVRPWVLVIEATRPNSTEDASYEWEPIVLSCGYVMVLFDGLNKFYVREDLVDIQDALSTPANVFDKWVSWELVETRRVLRVTTEESEQFARQLVERAETSEVYASWLEMLLNKANGWLPVRARTDRT